jgi:hypothetical protein
MFVEPKLFLLIHVILSVLGIISGLVVVGGLIAGAHFSRWIGFFLVTTLLTSLTGFGFPFVKLLPSHIVGALSVVVLIAAIVAAYRNARAFVVLSVIALYLNVFVLLAQLLAKIPALATLAPDPSAPAFGATQGLVLALFVLLGWMAMKGTAAARA